MATIRVVDDSTSVRNRVAFTLKEEGYDVHYALRRTTQVTRPQVHTNIDADHRKLGCNEAER